MRLMNLRSTLHSMVDEADETNTCLGTFILEQQEYVIVPLTITEQNRQITEAQPEELCRFKLNNQWCAILPKLAKSNWSEPDLRALLSNRELQIATLIAMGCPNKQVATKLHISEWTVATHLRRIFAKLGVDKRAAMIFHCAALIRGQPPSPILQNR